MNACFCYVAGIHLCYSAQPSHYAWVNCSVLCLWIFRHCSLLLKLTQHPHTPSSSDLVDCLFCDPFLFTGFSAWMLLSRLFFSVWFPRRFSDQVPTPAFRTLTFSLWAYRPRAWHFQLGEQTRGSTAAAGSASAVGIPLVRAPSPVSERWAGGKMPLSGRQERRRLPVIR